MMLIACLGWGSLVWAPRELPVRRGWFVDGPLLPIELARKSSDDRVTFVLLDKAPLVRILWALMSVSDLDLAKIALADREGMTSDPKTKYIGYWSPKEQSEGVGVGLIAKWAGHVGVEAVVWTDLPPKDFPEKYHPDCADKVIAHLRCPSLSHEKRRRIETELGWLPRGDDEDVVSF